jgi:aldose sugar dehydrogenase
MQTQGRNLPMQIAWHLLAIFTLLCLPVLKMGELWWDLPLRSLAPLALLLAAYVSSALAVLLFVRKTGLAAAARAFVITLCVFCLFLVVLLFMRSVTPRDLLVPIFAAAVVLIPCSVANALASIVGAGALGCLLVATLAFTASSTHASKPVGASETELLVHTTFYNLRVAVHEHATPMPATRGGGIDHLGDEILLGDGGGLLYTLRFTPHGGLQARVLPTHVPLNREEFAAANGDGSPAPEHWPNYNEQGRPPRVQTWRFRVADILTQTDGDAVRIFASHHYWKADQGCFVVRVSMIDGSLGALEDSLRANQWRTLYESSPCISLTGPQRKLGKNPFKGEQVGGRLALLDGDTLLLTLGDHGFSGIESPQAFSQDPQAAYGKTIRIDLNTRASEVYTLGHRNPQGLYVAGDGRVWLTEHGPQGGDELNLLVPQTNYGWPLVTYGVDYGAFAWPLDGHRGRHEGFAQPAFAWAPSIGVSSVTGVKRDLFAIWRGDLLIASLTARGLYRVVVDGDRVVLAERIDIGKRVRDILELNDGRLLLWTDEDALITLEPAIGMSGALSFSTLCSGCHRAVDGMTHRIGPDLLRVVGRPVASAPGFDDYSETLKALGGRWTKERLDEFLRDPQAMAPGSTMTFAGVEDDAERAALLEHLESLIRPPPRK